MGIVMGAGIYYLALYLIPGLGVFEGLLKSPWISEGGITQISLLVISLILMHLFSRGNLSTYGFKAIKIRRLIKPIVISIPTAFLMLILTGIMLMISGSIQDVGADSSQGKGILSSIISIVIIASICEELFARGLILGFLAPLKRYGLRLFGSRISLPVTVSGLGFGLGHFCLLGSMNGVLVTGIVLSATVLGFIAGYYREKTGSLIPAVSVHMTFNVVGLAISYIMM